VREEANSERAVALSPAFSVLAQQSQLILTASSDVGCTIGTSAYACIFSVDSFRRIGNNFDNSSLPKEWQGEYKMVEQNWQQLYHSAVLETDPVKMQERIDETEFAIRGRLHEFSLNHGGTPQENQAVVDALQALSVLRNEAAKWKSERAG
jgi:hypothetical protein